MSLKTLINVICLFVGYCPVVVFGECGPNVDSRGNLNMDFSLYNCGLQLMNDPLQPITHVKMYVDEGINLTVGVKFEFNNLVSVNEMENTATVDFFYRMYWQDIRWNMTKEFWDLAPLSTFYDGIELVGLAFESDNPLMFWRPDIHFIDVLEIETFAQLLKLRPGAYVIAHVIYQYTFYSLLSL